MNLFQAYRCPAPLCGDGNSHHPASRVEGRLRSLLTCRSRPDGNGCTGDERAVVGCGPACGQDSAAARPMGMRRGSCGASAASAIPAATSSGVIWLAGALPRPGRGV